MMDTNDKGGAARFDPLRGFLEWWTELEGWSFRCERAADDLQVADSHLPRLRAWPEAAYLTGFHARDITHAPGASNDQH